MWNLFDASSPDNNLTSGILNQPITSSIENGVLIGMTAKLISLATQNLDFTKRTYNINKSNLEISTLNKEANTERLEIELEHKDDNHNLMIELTKAMNTLSQTQNILIDQNNEIINLLKNIGGNK